MERLTERFGTPVTRTVARTRLNGTKVETVPLAAYSPSDVCFLELRRGTRWNASRNGSGPR